MKDTKTIIAENLIALRKKNNLTQNQLATKLNYSDNTISRWERAELCPTIENLEAIAEVYNVPLETLIKDNALGQSAVLDREHKFKLLITCIFLISLILFAVLITYFYLSTFFNMNLWMLFIWTVPACLIVWFRFIYKMKKRTYSFVLLTCFIWTTIASIYLQFLDYNIWLVFTLGIPAQIAWTAWCYIRPHSKIKENK